MADPTSTTNAPFVVDASQSGPYWDSIQKMQANTGNWTATLAALNKAGTAFSQSYQNALGTPPSAQDINNFFQQSIVGQPHPDFVDPYAAAQAYIPTAYGPQIQKYQQSQIPQNVSNVNTALNAVRQQGLDYYTQGPGMQQIQGSLNNSGMLDSGQFATSLASSLAGDEAQIGQSALTNSILPQIAGSQSIPYQGLLGLGQNAQSQLDQTGQGYENFNIQQIMAQALGNSSQPSGFMTDLGMATSAAGGAGGLLQGGVAAKNSTASYVCREMLRRNLLCETDLEDFYFHLFDAVWYKGRAFWHYKIHGQKLADAVNAKGLDWKVFKPLLFDRVMDEPDPCKAVDLFSDACHQLCISAAPELWDARIARTSLWDSLTYIPLLFFDKTYGKNFWRILRIKMMLVYDRPRCGFHRGPQS